MKRIPEEAKEAAQVSGTVDWVAKWQHVIIIVHYLRKNGK
jgi:hypothetical protein